MKNKLSILLVMCSLSLFAQKRGKDKQEYKEDLSKVEPSYTYNLDSLLIEKDSTSEIAIETHFDITNKLTPVLDSIVALNKSIKYIKGYKVLAYSGGSQEEALEIRKGILESFEEYSYFESTKVDFVWHQPTYRIYVGEYQKRLNAVRMSEFIKSYDFKFEDEEMTITPLVVPNKIQIRE